MDGITNTMDMSLSKFRELMMDREACPAVVCRAAKSGTRQSDQTTMVLNQGKAMCGYSKNGAMGKSKTEPSLET